MFQLQQILLEKLINLKWNKTYSGDTYYSDNLPKNLFPFFQAHKKDRMEISKFFRGFTPNQKPHFIYSLEYSFFVAIWYNMDLDLLSQKELEKLWSKKITDVE